MLADRFKEIVDFAKSESPYRSANKGWVTDDIYLQWGATKGKSSKEFDQLAEVSFYWKPIIQTVFMLLAIIFLATFFAFTPKAISKGGFQSFSGIIELASNLPVQQKVIEIQESTTSSQNVVSNPVPIENPQDINLEDVQLSETPSGVKETSPARNSGLVIRF